jgi:Predicted ATPase (AAA+ superfamily)
MAKSLKNVVGAWVEGADFWGREADVAILSKLINDGSNVSIVAQRRIGKTSLMREVSRRISVDRLCLHVDLQDAQHPGELISKLCEVTASYADIKSKWVVAFKNILGAMADRIDEINISDVGIKIRQAVVGEDWRTKGEKIMGVLASHDMPVVLFIDELPILIGRLLKGEGHLLTPEGVRSADIMMSWMRAQALAHPQQITMVLAGSIGLEPMLKYANLSATLNHYHSFQLEPWDQTTAKGCLYALAEGAGVVLTDDVVTHMLEKLKCYIPHHVQLFFSYVSQWCTRNTGRNCGVDEIDDIYTKSMLMSQGHMELAHMEERLKQEFDSKLFNVARDILTQAAKKRCVSVAQARTIWERHSLNVDHRDEQIILIFGILEHDGYLEKINGEYAFESALLRDWWEMQFGEYYTEVVVPL